MSVLDHTASLLQDEQAGLPAGRRRILEALQQDPQRFLDESFDTLAEQMDTSVPSIMRTVRDLGFAGLRDFKLALAQELAVSTPPLHRRVQRQDSTDQVVDKITKSAATAVNSVRATLDINALEQAAKAIVEAARTDCWCVGATSSFMANDFQARLFRLGLVANAYLDPHLQLVSAATLQRGSVAFAISHVGGMPSLLEAVDVARAQGATVIALTQAGTPLAQKADIVLGINVPDDPVMHVGTEAYLAHLTVIEILTVLVAQRSGDTAIQRLQNVRQILGTHGVDTNHQPFHYWQAREANGSQDES